MNGVDKNFGKNTAGKMEYRWKYSIIGPVGFYVTKLMIGQESGYYVITVTNGLVLHHVILWLSR
jgi:hypothetical protein